MIDLANRETEPFWLTYRTELEGVTLKGPPPVGLVHMRLTRGVRVLYGLNGAGKSSLLRALKSALSGIKDPAVQIAEVHIRISDPEDPLSDESLFEPSEHEDPYPKLALPFQILILLTRELAKRIEQFAIASGEPELGGDRTRAYEVANEMQGTSSVAQLIRWLHEFELERRTDEDPAILEEIAAQGRFILTPTGQGRPSWKVAVAARIDEDTPGLRACALHRLRAEEDLWQIVKSEQLHSRRNEGPDEVYEAMLRVPPRLTWEPDLLREGRYELGPAEFSYQLIEVGAVPITDNVGLPPVVDGNLDVDDYIYRLARVESERVNNRLIEGVIGEDVELTPEVAELLYTLTNRANYIYKYLLVDHPELRVRTLHPEDWVKDNPFRWEAKDLHTHTWVPLGALSQAQLRWARVAISLAFVRWQYEHEDDAQAFVILDEPEQALHTHAERHLIDGLIWAAKYTNATSIVATHSRELLNAGGVEISHVFRDREGSTTIAALTPSDRVELHLNLGLDLADTLQYYRVFLAVEGEHDKQLLDAWIGQDLNDAAVHIIPIRGAKALETINAYLLFQFTNAKLVVLLDAIGASSLPEVWSEIRTSNENKHQLLEKLAPFRDHKYLEVQAAATFCAVALNSGFSERLYFFGLKERDIINYLPVKEFVATAESWGSLFRAWKTAVPTGKPEFKDWLKSAKGASISAKNLKRIALDVREVPSEIRQLAALCRSLSTPLPISLP